MNRRLLAAPLALALLTLPACGSGSSGSSGSTGSSAASSADGTKTEVVVSFYPLEFATRRIGGQHVEVTNLTKPGAEPHDLEMTPQDVATASKAGLAIYEKGLQPSVDDAVKDLGDKAFDVSTAAKLTLPAVEGGEEEGGEHAEHAGHDHGTQDPHFWLDPQRYTAVSEAIAQRLGQVDPAHKADFDKNLQAFTTELKALDGEFRSGLKTCSNKKLVTGHAAFGYLADRYGFTQMPISGISPEQEPEPAKLAEIATFVKANKVSTIYTETLVSPATAETVAKETGATTAVLDPIEGINDKSAGKDYLEVMKSNLATLKKGQSCQ